MKPNISHFVYVKDLQVVCHNQSTLSTRSPYLNQQHFQHSQLIRRENRPQIIANNCARIKMVGKGWGQMVLK